MGLIKAIVVLIIAVGIADFIKKRQLDYKDHPYYGYISPYQFIYKNLYNRKVLLVIKIVLTCSYLSK